MSKQLQELKIGLLGGGQLGRMLLQEAINWDLTIAVLDPSADAPCKNMVEDFQVGNWQDFDTVYAFGKGKDILTIEFEDVNVDALQKLEEEGVKVFPQPHALRIIKDKGLQKTFYATHQIPTAPFALVQNKEEMLHCGISFPFFQKLRTSGYDGYGVRGVFSEKDLEKAFDAPSVIEEATPIDKELSVIVARNEEGEISTFPVVEMVFNPEANMVQYLFSPADISTEIATQANDLAKKIIDKLQLVGILAVEFFLDKSGKLLVNEVAPRPHNSGHHTIEANFTSQYEQHLRAILNLSLGNTAAILPSAMMNLLGEKDAQGIPVYKGFEKVIGVENVYLHLYGKKQVKSFRKMGHITILGKNLEEVRKKVAIIEQEIAITGK